jgi:hypothetical protein
VVGYQGILMGPAGDPERGRLGETVSPALRFCETPAKPTAAQRVWE